MSQTNTAVMTCGGFDHIGSDDVRFLQEAANLGALHVLLWSDDLLRLWTADEPMFPLAERKYFLESVRFIESVTVLDALPKDGALPSVPGVAAGLWVVRDGAIGPDWVSYCESWDMPCRVLTDDDLEGYPEIAPSSPSTGAARRVLVTGCYDWFHTGHIRFFEEVSELGDLYVVVGHDANVRALKGEGHPMFNEQQRRYMVASIRFVTQALVSTGDGWLDAEPELKRIKPDMYAVNEDGDKPEKKRYCEKHGLEYVVLKRLPKPGLPRRESTKLRGF